MIRAQYRSGRLSHLPLEYAPRDRRSRDPIAVVIGVAVLAGLSVVWLLTKCF
jgi:hypothetical protein